MDNSIPLKRCTKCGIEKPEDSFGMQPSRGRRRAECKECKAKSDKAWLEKRRLNPPQVKVETKQCNHCHETKPISRFSPANPGYFHGKCRDCENAIHQEKRCEQYQNDPEGKFYRPFINDHGDKIKRCPKCHQEKAYPNGFYSNGTRGYHAKCKECDNAICRAAYDANPEKYRAYAREYARQHPEQRRANFHRWQSANRERCLQRYRQYNETHREERRFYDRMRHFRDWEKERIYRITHRGNGAERMQRRRARQRNAPRIEKINRVAIIDRDKWTCYLCGIVCTRNNVTLDHVVPLFLGGTHTEDNLRVACRSCNCSKGAKPLRDFLK